MARRIAFLCHPYHRGGVTRWMVDAAVAFTKRGYEVYFITVRPVKEFISGKGNEPVIELLEKEQSAVKVLTVNASVNFELGTQQYRANVYSRLLKQLQPGTPVILSDDSAVWEAASKSPLPTIGVLHADEEKYYLLAGAYKDRITSFVAVSRRVSNTLAIKHPSIPQDMLHVIPCGINLPAAEQYIPDHKHNYELIYVGRVSEYQKRVFDLIDIATLLVQQQFPFHIHVAGNGPDKNGLEARIKEAGLVKEFTLYGWLDKKRIYELLEKSDILLLPSAFEGMPIAMMEALALGCSFVGTKVSGVEDFATHPLARDCFQVYNPGNIEDAVKCIRMACAVPVTDRRKAAIKLAGTEFSMGKCLRNYDAVISSIEGVKKPAEIDNFAFIKKIYSILISYIRYWKLTILK